MTNCKNKVMEALRSSVSLLAEKGQWDMVKIVVGENKKQKNKKEIIETRNLSGMNLINFASEQRAWDKVKWLIEQTKNVDALMPQNLRRNPFADENQLKKSQNAFRQLFSQTAVKGPHMFRARRIDVRSEELPFIKDIGTLLEAYADGDKKTCTAMCKKMDQYAKITPGMPKELAKRIKKIVKELKGPPPPSGRPRAGSAA